MDNIKTKQNIGIKGFTLIETLMSLLIFSVSIVALISITGSGVSDVTFAKKKQTSYLLAQEGIELVRFVRDSAIRSGVDWADLVSQPQYLRFCFSNNGCSIDPYQLALGTQISSAILMCPNTGCPFFYEEQTLGAGYQYSLGEKTFYKRTIRAVAYGGTTEEVQIISTVSWTHGGQEYQIEMTEFISNWVRPLASP